MATYQFRAPTWDDFPAVLDTLATYGHHQVGRLLEGEDDLRERWTSDYLNIADDARIFIDADGNVAGYIGVITPPPYVASYPWGFVHPDFSGEGLGTRLLEWAEQRARECTAAAPEDVRIVMRAEVIGTDEAALKIFAARGFTVVRHMQEMIIRFTEKPPEPVFPAGITMHQFDPAADLTELAIVAEYIFRDHWGHITRTEEEAIQRMQNRLKSPTFAPENWFLAKRNGEIVGLSLCDAVVPEDESIAWLLTLGVRKDQRKQGIALGLLHYTFGEFYRRGKTGVILGVDTQSLTNAVRLYERAGMLPYQRFDEPEKELRPGRRIDTH